MTSIEAAAKSSVSDSAETSQPAVPTSPKPLDDRKARFAALRARNTDSRKQNLAETKSEHSRLSTDTSALASITRKRDIAAHKLLQADTEAAGEDFERKRAWDWTIEESEKWDRRVEKKTKHRDGSAFGGYGDEARKIYKRDMRNVGTDKEAYEREKAGLIEQAVKGGGMEIVETSNGELIAVDRDGKFYSTADSTDFTGNRPTKEKIDRLVEDVRKAEEARLKASKKRRDAGDDGDVTYINDKNKLFNQKLARFYDKYTTDIRESFERGTAI